MSERKSKAVESPKVKAKGPSACPRLRLRKRIRPLTFTFGTLNSLMLSLAHSLLVLPLYMVLPDVVRRKDGDEMKVKKVKQPKVKVRGRMRFRRGLIRNCLVSVLRQGITIKNFLMVRRGLADGLLAFTLGCFTFFTFISTPAFAAQYCVESKFSEVDEAKLRKEDPKFHFLLTSPPYLRKAEGKKLIELEQRHIVRGYRAFPERPVSLDPLSVVGYQDIREQCPKMGFMCHEDEILVPYQWESPLPKTQERFRGFSPIESELGGPPLYDVLEVLRAAAVPDKKFEAITALQFLEENFGPVLLLGLFDLEKRKESVYRDQERVHQAWMGFKFQRQALVPHEYFHTHFPELQTVVFKLGKTFNIPPHLTLTDLQFVIQSHSDMRLLPQQKGLYPKTSRWCLPEDETQLREVFAHLQKPAFEVEYVPWTPPTSVLPVDTQQGDAAQEQEDETPRDTTEAPSSPVARELVKESVFSALLDPYAMTDTFAWNQAWTINLMGQIQRSAFMNLPERDLITAVPGEPPRLMIDESYLSGLWTEITQITDDARPTHWFTRLQAWVNSAYDWIQTSASQFVIHKGIDAETATSEGTVVRAHQVTGKVLEGKVLQPAFRLSREQVTRLFPPMTEIPSGSQYLVGASGVTQWVQTGIYHTAVQGKESPALALSSGGDQELHLKNPAAWQAQTWLRPKHSGLFGIEKWLPLQRWSDLDQPLVITPELWRKVAQWIHHLTQLPSESEEGWVETRLHQEQANTLFCSGGSPKSRESVRLCHYREDPFGAFYFGLAALDELQVLRFDFREGVEEVDVFFENLGAVVESSESLGKPEVLDYRDTVLAQAQVPEEYFMRRLAEGDSFSKSGLSLAQFFKFIQQPEPVYQKSGVGESFSFYDQPNYWVYTFPMEYQIPTPMGPQEIFQVDVMVQSKTSKTAQPIEISLPPSCTYKAGRRSYPQLIQVSDFSRWTTLPDGGSVPIPATLITVTCRSGDILFFVDGQPLRCDEQEGRQWYLNRVLFAKKVLKGFGETTSEAVNAFIHQTFCKSPAEWHETFDFALSKRVSLPIPTVLESFAQELVDLYIETGGAPPPRMIRVMQEGQTLRVFLGMNDGAIYTVRLTPEMQEGKTRWQMDLPLAPVSYRSAESVNFRYNLNPFSILQVNELRYRKPTDMVISKPLTVEFFKALHAQLKQEADSYGEVDYCPVAVGKPEDHIPSPFEKLVFNLVPDTEGRQIPVSAEPIYLLFLLTSSGSVFTGGHHALTKVVWVPDASYAGIEKKSEQDDLQSCVSLLKKVLGHELSIELNLTVAQSLEAFYSDESPVPHLMVNGVGDGGLALFSPAQLLGWDFTAMKEKPEETQNIWITWAKHLLQFVPSHYFYFGQKAQEPPALFTHQAQGACLAFEKRTSGILSHASAAMDTCRSFVTPEVLAQHDAQRDVSGSQVHYAHKFYHVYQAPDDSELLLREGSELLSTHLLEEGEGLGENLLPTTPQLSAEPPQARVAQTYDVFYDPLEGQANLIRFDAMSSVPVPEPLAKPDSGQGMQERIAKAFDPEKRLDPLLELTGKSSAKSVLVNALKRYFCSFFTVYQGLDHLKVDPRDARGDMPLYLTDMGVPRAFARPGARFLVFLNKHSGKYFFLERVKKIPFDVPEEEIALSTNAGPDFQFQDAELDRFNAVLDRLTDEDPFWWVVERELSHKTVETLQLIAKSYLRLTSENHVMPFKIWQQPSGVEVSVKDNVMKFKRRELHLYRGDSKTIVDSGESDIDVDGDSEHRIHVGGESTLPIACETLKSDGVVKTQAVYQLKVSSVDEWREGFLKLKGPLGEYAQEVQAALRDLKRTPEGQGALAVVRRLRSSLLAPEFIDALAHVSLPEWIDRRPDVTQAHLEKMVTALLQDRPFVNRMRQVMSPSGFGAEISALAQQWAGYLSEDTPEILQQKKIREQFLTLFLNQFIAQIIMYTEYFSPLVQQSYETFFGGASIPQAQAALMNAVAFPTMGPEGGPEFRQEVVRRLSRYLSFEVQGTEVPEQAVWDRLKLCSIDGETQEARCDGQSQGVRLSENSRGFLNYFIEGSFRAALLGKGITREQLPEVLATYRRLFVKQIYFVGVVQAETTPSTDRGPLVLPLSVFLIHQRPNLAVWSAEGRAYLDDPWGDPSSRSGFLHPYFDLTYLFKLPNVDQNRYEENFGWLNRWGVDLASQHRVENRLYQSEGGRPLALGFESPARSEDWSLEKVASWLVTTPFKMTEFSALEGTGDFPPAQLSHEAEILQNRLAARESVSLADINELANRARIHFGVDRNYPSQKVPDPTDPSKTLLRLIEGADVYHFDYINKMSLAPADDHWVLFNQGFRSLPDVFFQTLWDKWVHIPQAKEAIPVPSRLRDGGGEEFQALFGELHQSLYQFIYRSLENPKAEPRLYDLEHVNQLWELVHKLTADERFHVKGISAYVDLLAVEVMFPMIWRYVQFPKHFQEFNTAIASNAVVEDCDAYFRDPQIDFEFESHPCLEARTKRHLRSYYDDPEYFFVWDFNDWSKDESERFGFQHLFETLFTSHKIIAPFEPMTSAGGLRLNPRFWLTQAEGSADYVPGYSGKDGVAGQAQKAYTTYLDRYHLRRSGEQHLWASRQRAGPVTMTPTSVFDRLWRYISGGLLEVTPESPFVFIPVSAQDIARFFAFGNQPGGDLFQVAEALELRVLEEERAPGKAKTQRYNRSRLLMDQSNALDRARDYRLDVSTLSPDVFEQGLLGLPLPEVQFDHRPATHEVEVSGCVGVSCFDYVFETHPDQWEFHTELAAESSVALLARRQMLQSIVAYLDSELAPSLDSESPPSSEQATRYLLHVADWEAVSPTLQVVAVNVTQSVVSLEGRDEIPVAMLFRFEKTADETWRLSEPVDEQVQKFGWARLVGPIEVQGTGPDQVVCTPLIVQQQQRVQAQEGGEEQIQYIPVFVKRCARFINQQQLKNLAQWLGGR